MAEEAGPEGSPHNRGFSPRAAGTPAALLAPRGNFKEDAQVAREAQSKARGQTAAPEAPLRMCALSLLVGSPLPFRVHANKSAR